MIIGPIAKKFGRSHVKIYSTKEYKIIANGGNAIRDQQIRVGEKVGS